MSMEMIENTTEQREEALIDHRAARDSAAQAMMMAVMLFPSTHRLPRPGPP